MLNQTVIIGTVKRVRFDEEGFTIFIQNEKSLIPIYIPSKLEDKKIFVGDVVGIKGKLVMNKDVLVIKPTSWSVFSKEEINSY